MEDDDDFGDLYTDVLQSFPFTSQPSSSAPQRGIDLNLEVDEEEDEEERRDGTTGNFNSGLGKPLAPHAVIGRAGLELNMSDAGDDSGRESGSRNVKKHGSEIPGLENAYGGGGGNYDEDSFRFDLEEEAQDGDAGSEPVIPGLSTGLGGGEGFHGLGREENGGDDWDSDDSEDDLQIVLNDTDHGLIGVEMGGALGGELDDGQNEGLGIGVDGDRVGFQHHVMEETEWGEDGAQAADGEKKEGGEVPKMNQGIAMAAKPGYGGHGYHQFHSPFKIKIINSMLLLECERLK